MDKIKLLYAKNVITRKSIVRQQNLTFIILVDNLAYDKKVNVEWAGENGVWHTIRASYHSSVGQDREYWIARLAFVPAADESLPGNVQFALRYRVTDAEYWDNNHGKNYCIQADSGITVGHDIPVLNVGLEGSLSKGERRLPMTVAVDRRIKAEKVTIDWTTDNWKTKQQSACRYTPNYWDTEYLSNARNPNQYGYQIWNEVLNVNDAFSVQYRIICETRQRVIWDDNFGHNYSVQRRALKVLILNLHCCQEDNQDYKLSQIARAIDDLDVDIVCLQEVAELWNNGQGNWDTNTARIINDRLASPYNMVTDWSHLGFDRYREGVAILSRYPIEKHDGRYVSNSHDPFSIHSRKVVMARIKVPYVGLINVFSSHLSWWDDGFPEQFEKLRRWATDESNSQIKATMLCGDFNIKAGSPGYQRVVESNEYEDQYLSATAPHIFRKIFERKDSHWHRDLDMDHRIDYEFLRKGSKLCVTSGRVLFTDQDYGRVSDHFGYLMTYVPK